jgi:hypothetical protein
MDRLQEANKVATLMRRRENLKTVTAEQVDCVSSLLPRAFAENLAWPKSGLSPRMLRPLEICGGTRMAARAENYLPPLPHAAAFDAVARSTDYVPSIAASRRMVELAALHVRAPRTGLLQARAVPVRPDRCYAAQRPRDFGTYRRCHSPVQHRAGSRRDVAGGGFHSATASHTKNLALAPKQGQCLRVSASRGFRVGRAVLRKSEIGWMAAIEMTWPAWLSVTIPPRQGTSCAREEQTRLPYPRLRLPRSPGAARENPMARRAPRVLPGAMAEWQTERRGCAVIWRHFADHYDVFSAPVELEPQLEFQAWQSGGRLNMVPQALVGGLRPQLAEVPFEPQEPPFGYSPLEIHTNMPSAPGESVTASAETSVAAPAEQAAVAAQSTIEERFEAGLRNWIGKTDDWKIDVAGVRTGSLALFAPSLDLVDYDLEFLARVDQHSLTWLFRASDENEYQVASIANIPGGRSFARSTVLGGNPGLSVSKSLRAPANPKSAITVQTRIRGNEFSVSIDGETIDRWTDNRLPIGGIGFMGKPDDRARLYWVRVSPTAIGKERGTS